MVSRVRHIRVSDEVWAWWCAAADVRGVSVSVLVRDAVEVELRRGVDAPAESSPRLVSGVRALGSPAVVDLPAGKVFRGPDPK